MRVAFVGYAQEQLAIGLLSSVLRRAGHETTLAFAPALFRDRYYFDVEPLGALLARDGALVDQIVAAKPDLVAMSPLTFTYAWCVDLAAAVKRRVPVPVVFGGVHASAVPDVVLDSGVVDYVCVGEGEAAIVALCEALETGRPRRPIGNLWWREGERTVRGPAQPFVQDLDALPHWDKELWATATPIRNSWLTMASRGCPYRCTFCFNNHFARLGAPGGKYLRLRSVGHVMEELREARSRWGARFVELSDDILTVDKGWVRELLARYGREVGVPFSCLVHARYVDRDIAGWLADAGCARVQIGMQTAEPAVRRRLGRHETEPHMVDALGALLDAGLEVKLDHMFGLPDEPFEAQEAARRLYASQTPAHVNTYWLSWLPGTQILDEALASGVLSQADVDDIHRGRTRTFHHQREGRGVSRELLRAYRRYEVLFRALPLLPPWARRRLRAEHLPPMSERVANGVGFALDLTNAVLRRDAETAIYARHYASLLGRQLRAGRAPLTVLPPIGEMQGGAMRRAGGS